MSCCNAPPLIVLHDGTQQSTLRLSVSAGCEARIVAYVLSCSETVRRWLGMAHGGGGGLGRCPRRYAGNDQRLRLARRVVLALVNT